MCPKWPQNCQQWPNFENNFTYLRPSRRRREGRHYRKHMLDDPPNMIDLINYVFCSSQSLCSNHSMWPFVAFYVPEVHGDIPPSLMVLLLLKVPVTFQTLHSIGILHLEASLRSTSNLPHQGGGNSPGLTQLVPLSQERGREA